MKVNPPAGELRSNVEGGYRYIPYLFQYSSGVLADPGYELERVRFHRPRPLAEAFAAVQAHLRALGRPIAAFAQCELRSPRPYTEEGFRAFNEGYAEVLRGWGLCDGEHTPVARTHVCPQHDAPEGPAMHAYAYTVPGTAGRRSFALAGGGDVRPGPGTFLERCVRPGDSSPEGLREKVRHVIGEMERRLALLGVGWAEAVSTQCYTIEDIGHLVGEELAARGAIPAGLVWTYARLPVQGLAFEMDVRGTVREHIV